MTIVDSSVWVDALTGRSTPQTNWLQGQLEISVLGVTDNILCEVLQGVRRDELFQPFRNDLLRFLVHDSGGAEIATDAAEKYRWLRKRGITIRGTIDCMTASYCIRKGHSLLHADRDFGAFEQYFGLKVVHPKARDGVNP